eukprot:742012-Hanusia_phi.AAC.2
MSEPTNRQKRSRGKASPVQQQTSHEAPLPSTTAPTTNNQHETTSILLQLLDISITPKVEQSHFNTIAQIVDQHGEKLELLQRCAQILLKKIQTPEHIGSDRLNSQTAIEKLFYATIPYTEWNRIVDVPQEFIEFFVSANNTTGIKIKNNGDFHRHLSKFLIRSLLNLPCNRIPQGTAEALVKILSNTSDSFLEALNRSYNHFDFLSKAIELIEFTLGGMDLSDHTTLDIREDESLYRVNAIFNLIEKITQPDMAECYLSHDTPLLHSHETVFADVICKILKIGTTGETFLEASISQKYYQGICSLLDPSKYIENFPRNLYTVCIFSNTFSTWRYRDNEINRKLRDLHMVIRNLIKKCLHKISQDGTATIFNRSREMSERDFIHKAACRSSQSLMEWSLREWIIDMESNIFCNNPRFRMDVIQKEIEEDKQINELDGVIAHLQEQISKVRGELFDAQEESKRHKQSLDNLKAQNEDLINQNQDLRATTDKTKCVYCSRSAQKAAIPCGHMIVCSEHDFNTNIHALCPHCRQPIQQIVR